MNDLPLPFKSCAVSPILTNSHFICIDLRKSAESAGNIFSIPQISQIIADVSSMVLKILRKPEESNKCS